MRKSPLLPLLLAVVWPGPAAALAAAAPVLGKITVAAGEFARQHTPVTMKLPPTLAGKPLELRGGGAVLPVVVAPGGDASFVLQRLGKGATARFDLVEAKAKPASAGVEVQPTPGGLAVTVAGKPTLSYQALGEAPRPEIGKEFVRGGYIHPVLTPSGVLVTDDYPADHKHHHGIWTAWTSTEYEGRKPDFWNMGKKGGRKDHVALGTSFSGAVAGGFSARISSTDMGASPAKVVLDEHWQVTVYRTHAKAPPYYLFDLIWTDTLVGTSPLVLPEYRYGGLGVRGNIAWLDKANAFFLTSEGKDRVSGDNTPARWLHMGGKVGGKVGGKLAGIATLDHPGNFRAPQPLRIHPDEPYFSVAPPKAGKFSIQPGQPYVSRYRFVVADGPPDKALLERLFNDYAQPPVVTVSLVE